MDGLLLRGTEAPLIEGSLQRELKAGRPAARPFFGPAFLAYRASFLACNANQPTFEVRKNCIDFSCAVLSHIAERQAPEKSRQD